MWTQSSGAWNLLVYFAFTYLYCTVLFLELKLYNTRVKSYAAGEDSLLILLKWVLDMYFHTAECEMMVYTIMERVGP